jgi:hypothetical protein
MSPKTLLTMTRHSTAELALKVYAKPRLAAIKETVQQMPDI